MKKLTVNLIPVYILEDKDTVEDVPDDMCYLIAKNGYFKKMKHNLYDAVHPVEELPGLAEVDEMTATSVLKIPLNLLKQVGNWFADVYTKYKSEAVVILFYNYKKNLYHVEVPKQEVSGAGVNYKSVTQGPKGFDRIGTIHSHADFGAFHSGTDDHDEESFDGLHITIGDCNKDEKSYSARIMCSKKEFKVDIVNILTAQPYPVEAPKTWMKQIKEKTYSYNRSYGKNYNHGGWPGYPDNFGYYGDDDVINKSCGKSGVGANYKHLIEDDLQPLTEEEKKMIVAGNFVE